MSDAILVTGASGFVGTHLVGALREEGRPVVTHSRADGDIATCSLPGFGVGHVVHLAGRIFVPDSWENPRAFYGANVLGTVNVLEFCRRRAIPLTYVSSYIYGIPRQLPIREDHPVAPLNPYTHSKILAEEAVAYFANQFGVQTAVIRPFNAYGPGQDARFLIPTLVRQALDPGTDRITVQDLRPRRDFIHVRDLVSLLVATLSRPTVGVFNAGSGRSVAIPELVEHINQGLDHPKPLVSTGEERSAEVFDVVADISRARRELGWEPRIGIGEGLRETVRWTQAQLAAIR
jgi:nucleoside-diphosphate-sugar epimerase